MEKVTAVYFSPTGGTRSCVKTVAAEIDAGYAEVNLTSPEVRAADRNFGADELAVIGAPVYYGRLPQIERGILGSLHGDGTPAVIVVSYGNRDYEDALLELADLCAKQGFRPVAGGAFVAQHSLSEKIASGRPDKEDLAAAARLGKSVAGLAEDGGVFAEREFPGRRPYRLFSVMPFYPKGKKECAECGECVRACPTEAISADDPRSTDPAKCLRCLRCVRVCPVHARRLGGGVAAGIAVRRLEDNLTKERRAPELFLPKTGAY